MTNEPTYRLTTNEEGLPELVREDIYDDEQPTDICDEMSPRRLKRYNEEIEQENSED